MKRFHFALQPAMGWRERKADQERARLAVLHEEKNVLARLHASLGAELNRISDDLSRSSGVTGEEMRQLTSYHSVIETRLRQTIRREADCACRVAEQQKRCIEADRDFKLLEKLKDKQYGEWVRARDKEQDEVALESFMAMRQRV